MGFEGITLSEMSKTNTAWPHFCVEPKKQTQKPTNRTQRPSSRSPRLPLWLRTPLQRGTHMPFRSRFSAGTQRLGAQGAPSGRAVSASGPLGPHGNHLEGLPSFQSFCLGRTWLLPSYLQERRLKQAFLFKSPHDHGASREVQSWARSQSAGPGVDT